MVVDVIVSTCCRWGLALMDYYGHKQIRTANFLSRVKHCKLAEYNLTKVDLQGLFSIEVLDLSGNRLKKVDGLKEMLA